MNAVDILIIFLVLGAIVRGLDLGFVRQIFSTIGFFAGLLLGALIEPHIIDLAHTPLTRLAITLTATLGTGLVFLFIGEIIGIIVKQKIQFENMLNRLDNAFGSVLAGLSVLLMVWLSTAIAIKLPYPDVQTSLLNSKVISLLTQNLPPAPNLIAGIGHLINPNGLPDVFVGNEPAPNVTTNVPEPGDLAAAVNADRASVVKIEGQGCGGIVEGSGFVVDDTLVATNAHVVAGIETPYVIDDRGTHHATPVWFDPDLDFALLRVSDLAGPPLPFSSDTVTAGAQGGVLGYPGGGAFVADGAAVLEEFTAVGRDIYNQHTTERNVYSIQATVVPGNSGGPLIDLNGKVLGVVFATSTTHSNVGYALSAPEVLREINQAKTFTQPAATGNCAE